MAVKEWEMQAYVSTQLKRLGILHHGDQNAGKRGPKAQAVAKATGMCPGWPDMVVVLDYEVIIFFEFKTLYGKQSDNQLYIEEKLLSYGFPYYVIKSDDKLDAWDQVREVLGKHG